MIGPWRANDEKQAILRRLPSLLYMPPLPPSSSPVSCCTSGDSWERLTALSIPEVPIETSSKALPIVDGGRMGLPALLACNAVMLAVGFFLGRKSISLEITLGLFL